MDLPPSIGDGEHTVRLIVESGDGSVVAEARAVVEVDRSIRFVPSSLSWDPSSVSGTISVRNCTPATPKLNVRLRCRGGRLVVESTVGASVAAGGAGTLSFDLPDLPPVELGSCRMELVGGDGEVLDSIDLAELLPTSDGERDRERRPDRRPRARRALLGAAVVGIIGVVAILFWPTNGPDPPVGQGAVIDVEVEQDDVRFVLTVFSIGDADLVVEDVTFLQGADAFLIVDESCTVDPVQPGRRCEIVIELRDSLPSGRYVGEVALRSNSTEGPSTAVLGPVSPRELPPAGEAEAELNVEQDDFEFRVFVVNVGDAELLVGDVALLGPEAFRVTREDCIGRPVASGAACTIDVVLEPPSEGRYDAELLVRSNAAGSPSTVVFGADAIF